MPITPQSIIMAPSREVAERIIRRGGPNARIVYELPLVNGYVVEGTLKDDIFKDIPDNVSLVPNRVLPWIPPVRVRDVDTSDLFQSDPEPEKPAVSRTLKTLDMEKVWKQGYTGKGIGIAILDSGIHPHDDLKDHIGIFLNFVGEESDPIDPVPPVQRAARDGIRGPREPASSDPRNAGPVESEPFDDVGHGTHVAGDAAGSGKASKGKYRGPAYEATLIGLKVGDRVGPSISSAIKAVQWAVDNKEKYNIRVMNLSFGGPGIDPWQKDPMVMALEKAVEAGIIPVVAAGNEGPSAETIGSPGNAPHAVTVGALNENDTPDRGDDDVAFFSSRGPTSDGRTKPTVVSPGVDIVAPRAGTRNRYVSFDGTSMASPIAAGVIATWLQANPDLTPDQVQQILNATSLPLKDGRLSENDQGKGMIDPVKGIEMALALKETKEVRRAAA